MGTPFPPHYTPDLTVFDGAAPMPFLTALNMFVYFAVYVYQAECILSQLVKCM